MPATRFRIVSLLFMQTFGAASGAWADIDLTGRWHQGSGEFAHIAQTESTVVVTWTGDYGGGEMDLTLTGSFNQPYLSASDGFYFLGMSVYGPGNVLDGVFGGTGAYQTGHAQWTRCECFDGNVVDGDGCDSGCRVEPCFTCTPEPSTCFPSADGAACDDSNDCTTGEQCSAGSCGGGTTASPCVDLDGRWRVAQETTNWIDGSVYRHTFETQIDQTDAVLRSTEDGIGMIDAATGEADLLLRGSFYQCGHRSDLSLTASSNGRSYAGQGRSYWSHIRFCGSNGFTQQATKCHDELGCDLTDCTGLADGTPCSDGDDGTWRDECEGEVCVGGPPDCPPCQAASGDTCEPIPRSDCAVSTRPESSGMKLSAVPGRQSLQWTWKRGPALTTEDFGHPDYGDDVSFCVFEDDGEPSLIYMETLPGNATCDEPPCWESSSNGFQYKPRGELPTGLTSISLRSGSEGRSSVKIRGKGESLTDAYYLFPAPPLPLPLRTQVQIEGGACFEVRFDTGGVSSNDDWIFKGKGTP